MKLNLYVWQKHHVSNGLWVAFYKTWYEVANWMDLWLDDSYVFTVIYEEEPLEVEVLDSTVIRYKFIDSEGEIVADDFTLEQIENGAVEEWFEVEGGDIEIIERTLVIGEKKERERRG